ncbi:MAG: Chaperone protein DnaK [uncultured Chloroflexia bacterium]|uniref:Chaperone protein DnaK n=1 Tax=uncultured Chloroflexia bacterium TaxID=1672391 RepID=A0A6J4M821_9CHLR|nr:MAG: Chaperone protein DnaK [uncultured Chloroflexia bacterium]
MSGVVGIDLGTTFSSVAIVRDGAPQILPHGDERIMPSIVGMTVDGSLLVGTPARNQYLLYPQRTIRSIKRQMGENVKVTLDEHEFTPSEISAMILRELKRSAEAALGHPVERAVITVPAYFSDAARQATHEAGAIAGFTVERIINEPTAAALAYGLERGDERQLVAVYDLGGGTFDVSIIELDAGVVEVRASHGNTRLGGDDFDQLLVDWLAERFTEQHSVDPRSDVRALARLTRAAETAKIALSSQPFVQVREEYLFSVAGRPLHLEVEIARSDFEDMIADLLEGTLDSFDQALKDAGVETDELDSILFVGGSTRIPLVGRMVQEHTGIEPQTAINPDEAVALGAAVQAAIIAGEPLDAILVDVTPHSLGIEVAEQHFGEIIPGRFSVLIPRNTTIPTSRSEAYAALHPQQTAIELKIYQGEHPVAAHNTLLGEFFFNELRPEVPGMPPRITVQFDFDLDGIVQVSAVDRGSGKQVQTTVRAARAHLTPAEITAARVDLEALQWADDLWPGEEEVDGEVIDALAAPLRVAQADPGTAAILARARSVVEQSGGDVSRLRQAIHDVEAAVARGDAAQIEVQAEALLDVLYDIEED